MGALTFVCATPPVKGQILSISHESIQVMGFMHAEQTSNGESKIKYAVHKLKTSEHKMYKTLSSKNRNSQTYHTEKNQHNILKNTIMLS